MAITASKQLQTLIQSPIQKQARLLHNQLRHKGLIIYSGCFQIRAANVGSPLTSIVLLEAETGQDKGLGTIRHPLLLAGSFDNNVRQLNSSLNIGLKMHLLWHAKCMVLLGRYRHMPRIYLRQISASMYLGVATPTAWSLRNFRADKWHRVHLIYTGKCQLSVLSERKGRYTLFALMIHAFPKFASPSQCYADKFPSHSSPLFFPKQWCSAGLCLLSGIWKDIG